LRLGFDRCAGVTRDVRTAIEDYTCRICDMFSPMQTPEVTAYLKTYCGWSAGVRAVLAKYNLPYTEKDIIQNPAFRWEMETKSGQPLSPCVEINGRMLADVSGEEVERYLIENKLVEASDATTDVPTNAPCANEQHEGVVKLNL
jgi:glutaredoxin-related protein